MASPRGSGPPGGRSWPASELKPIGSRGPPRRPLRRGRRGGAHFVTSGPGGTRTLLPNEQPDNELGKPPPEGGAKPGAVSDDWLGELVRTLTDEERARLAAELRQ